MDEVVASALANWGIPYLYPYQELVTRGLLDREEVRQAVVLPTGAGKSLCFQLPAALFPHPTLVIYPLRSLTADQKRRNDRAGLATVVLQGGQTRAQRNQIWDQLEAGGPKMVLTNPETLAQPRVLDRLKALPWSHAVVDEAHCVELWGNSFRPGYRQLAGVLDALRVPRMTAFTATATNRVVADWGHSLFGGKEFTTIRVSADRPNLEFDHECYLSLRKSLPRALLREQRPALVFCRSRELVRRWAHHLHRETALEVRFYHAGLSREEKASVEGWFLGSTDGVLVATNAYGMPVDTYGEHSYNSLVHTFNVYCRRSTTDQTSLDAQEAQGIATATGFPSHVVKVVKETMSGATIEKRPAFNALVAGLKKGDVLSVWDASRLGRNALEVQSVREAIRRIGATLLEGGHEYEDTPTDRLQSQVIDAVSEFQRSIQREKSIKGIDFRHGSGDWIVRDCFGYNRKGKEISTNPEEAERVKEVFALYQSGKTLNQICKVLNYQTNTKRGGRWTPTTVRRLLLRPLYAGYYYKERAGQGKGVYTQAASFQQSRLIKSNHYEPIITLEQFGTCLDLLLNRELPHQASLERRRGKHLLTGLLLCEKCFIAGKAKSDTSYRHCKMNVNGKKENYIVISATHPTHEDSRSALPRWFCESVVKTSVREFFSLRNPDSLVYQYLTAFQKKKKKAVIEVVSDKKILLNNMKEKAKELQRETEIGIGNLFRLTGTLAEMLQSRLEVLTAELEEIKVAMKQIEQEIVEQTNTAELAAIWVSESLSKVESTNIQEARQALTEIIDRILLTKDFMTLQFRAGINLTVFLPVQIRKTRNEVEAYWDAVDDTLGDDLLRLPKIVLKI